MAKDDQLYNIVLQCLEDSDVYFPGVPATPAFLAICMVGEAGEFCNILKKILRGSLDPQDPKVQLDLRMELVDVFIYLCNLAGRLEMDIVEAYNLKREENNRRFAHA